MCQSHQSLCSQENADFTIYKRETSGSRNIGKVSVTHVLADPVVYFNDKHLAFHIGTVYHLNKYCYYINSLVLMDLFSCTVCLGAAG